MTFHKEGIGWCGSGLYSLLSHSRLMHDIYESVAEEICTIMSEGKILDVGTGPGLIPIMIAQTSSTLEVHGVDISKPMIEIAARNARKAGLSENLFFKVGSVYSLPYEDDSFDMVISTLSLHHWVEPVRGLNEIFRVLRPGGEALIYDFRRDQTTDMKKEVRKKYGWLLGSFCLWLTLLHSSISMGWVQGLMAEPELKFKDREIEGKGILFRLKFKEQIYGPLSRVAKACTSLGQIAAGHSAASREHSTA